MRLKRSYYVFETLIILAILNVASSYLIDPTNGIGEMLSGLKWQNPKIFFFNLNPRIDRFLFWIIEDTILCMLFMITAYRVINLSYSKKWHRAIAWLVHSYYLVELGTGIIIQVFNAGVSYNDEFLLKFTGLVFIYRLRFDIFYWFKSKLEKIKRIFNNLTRKNNAGKTG